MKVRIEEKTRSPNAIRRSRKKKKKEMVELKNTSIHFEKKCLAVPTETNICLPYDLINSTSGYIPKKNECIYP